MDTPFTLMWTHAAYWFIAVAMVLITRRLRLQVERVAARLEKETKA